MKYQTVLQYDERSNNFTHMDVNTKTGELTPHRFAHKVGSKIKEVFKMDQKTRKLVKIDQYDIDKYINSFREETNIKDNIERLRAKGVSPQEYIKRNGGFFSDISEAPSTVLESIIMAQTWEDKVDAYDRWKAKQPVEPVVQPVVQPVVEPKTEKEVTK